MAASIDLFSQQPAIDVTSHVVEPSDITLSVEQKNALNVKKTDSTTADENSQGTPNAELTGSSQIAQSGAASNVTSNGGPELGNKRRSVKFPEGVDIVSGSTEPPSPWIHSSTCTTEGLVKAYRFACEVQNVKPIPMLLQQLHAINDFCDRNETLMLKGERLEARAVETLEEVLRRVQFRTIDVENTHLDEEGAIALFDMLEYYESAEKLNIAYNKNFGPRGWQTPCLHHLDARSCAITDQIMPMLGRSLRLDSQLQTLHLENSVLSGRPLMILVAAIKMNDTLRSLFLADNKLMPSDGIQLGNMLKFNHKLQLLDVRNNHLQDVGTQHMCDGLFEQNLDCGLQTLVLWNNQITYQAIPAISRALRNTRSLETLNLGHNSITNEGCHRLKDGLLQNKSLLRLGLQAAKVTCEGAVALAEFIADSPRLIRLDLRENDVRTGGIMALTLSLKVSETVTRLDLDKDTKKETAFKDYAEQQKRFLADIANYLQRNRELTRRRDEQEQERRRREPETTPSGHETMPTGPTERAPQGIVSSEAINMIVTETMKNGLSVTQQPASAAAPSPSNEQTEEAGGPGAEESLGQTEAAPEAHSPTLKAAVERRGLPLRWSTQQTDTLESPAFIPEGALPFVTPPSQAEIEAAAALAKQEAGFDEAPKEFPPSPMTSHAQGRTFLEASLEDNDDTLVANPDRGSNSSPRTNESRKFIVSPVREDCSVSVTHTQDPSVRPAEPPVDNGKDGTNGCPVAMATGSPEIATEFSDNALRVELASAVSCTIPTNNDVTQSEGTPQADSHQSDERPALSEAKDVEQTDVTACDEGPVSQADSSCQSATSEGSTTDQCGSTPADDANTDVTAPCDVAATDVSSPPDDHTSDTRVTSVEAVLVTSELTDLPPDTEPCSNSELSEESVQQTGSGAQCNSLADELREADSIKTQSANTDDGASGDPSPTNTPPSQ